MPSRIQMSYGSASSVKPKWSGSSFSGGVGAGSNNLGKSSRTAYGDGAANLMKIRECMYNCTDGNISGPNAKSCCQGCGGGSLCNGMT